MDAYKFFLPSMSSSFFDIKTWSVLIFVIVYVNMISHSNVPSIFGIWIFRATLLTLLFAILCYDITIGSLFAVATVISIVYSEIHKSKLIESMGNVEENVEENEENVIPENFLGYTTLEEETGYSTSVPIFQETDMNNSVIPLKTASNYFLVNKES